MASQNGHSNIVDVLLKAGGDPNIARDVSGIVELNGSFVYHGYMCLRTIIDGYGPCITSCVVLGGCRR